MSTAMHLTPAQLQRINAMQLVDNASYSQYAFNRRRSPAITPERWAKIWPNQAALEARYQFERMMQERAGVFAAFRNGEASTLERPGE